MWLLCHSHLDSNKREYAGIKEHVSYARAGFEKTGFVKKKKRRNVSRKTSKMYYEIDTVISVTLRHSVLRAFYSLPRA